MVFKNIQSVKLSITELQKITHYEINFFIRFFINIRL